MDLQRIFKSEAKNFALADHEFIRNPTNFKGEEKEIFFCDIGTNDHGTRGFSIEFEADGVIKVWSYETSTLVEELPIPWDAETLEAKVWEYKRKSSEANL